MKPYELIRSLLLGNRSWEQFAILLARVSLGVYDVSYQGSNFLVRVSAVDAGAYVSAVDPRGQPATGEAPSKAIAALKAALGAN